MNKKALLALSLASVLALQPQSMVAGWNWERGAAWTAGLSLAAIGLHAAYQYYWNYNCLNEDSTADDVFNNLTNYNINGIFTVSPNNVRQALLKDNLKLGRDAQDNLNFNTARYDRTRIGSKEILKLYKQHKIAIE